MVLLMCVHESYDKRDPGKGIGLTMLSVTQRDAKVRWGVLVARLAYFLGFRIFGTGP